MDIINGFIDSIKGIINTSGFVSNPWQNYVMIVISFVLIYLAIKKQFEPLLLLPISFGMLLVNLFPAIMAAPTDTANGGLFYYLYQGVKLGIYPPLIFLGIGAMTDFGPLIANPKSFLLGAAAQLGIFLTFIGASSIGPHCSCRLFIHGLGTHYSASYHEGADHQKRAYDCYGAASSGFQAGKNSFPDYCYLLNCPAAA